MLRLRQCCCHLNLLTSVLGKGEDDQDQVDLAVAMSALTLDKEEQRDAHILKVRERERESGYENSILKKSCYTATVVIFKSCFVAAITSVC